MRLLLLVLVLFFSLQSVYASEEIDELAKTKAKQFEVPDGSFSVDDAYLLNCVAGGNAWKQSAMPLKVYFRPPAPADGCKPNFIVDAKNSLQVWTTALKGRVRFIIVPTAKADIEICWTSNPQKLFDPGKRGSTTFTHRSGDLHDRALITVLTVWNGTPDDVRMRMLFLHEIGHAIGLNGHSRDPSDVMYPTVTKPAPSARDVKTFNYIDSTPPDTLLENMLTLAQKELPSDHPIVVGLENRLARNYYVAKKYESAATVYQKCAEAAKASGDNKALYSSLRQLASCYAELDKADETIATIESMQELKKNIPDVSGSEPEINANISFAGSYYRLKKYDLAAPFYAKGVDEARQSGDKKNLDLCLEYLETCYEKQRSFDESVTILKSLLDLRKETAGVNSPKFAWCLYHLGFIAQSQGQNLEAETYLRKACAIYTKHPGEVSAAPCLQEYKSLIEYLQKLKLKGPQ